MDAGINLLHYFDQKDPVLAAVFWLLAGLSLLTWFLLFWKGAGLALLASTATTAPFIGLFGTVWGVYRTLTAISAQQSASLAVVSGPMGEALVATAFGLFVAIPAVLFYNLLGRINSVHHQLLLQLAERLQHSCLYHPDKAEAGQTVPDVQQEAI
ncbi:MotA/TolQ/ExbB proton channel family protein [Marinimicrobium locisalis]|uniref:MotA/TolQ/ExbB proton channel family protein n=1 Tax=Marinimicrobium locisalis TaxID=546022 RepID=UPI003221D7F1